MYKDREEESIKQFDKWASKYDHGLWNSYFKSAYSKVINISEKYISPGAKVLDIGCGTGELEFLLSEKVGKGEIVGLDISKIMVERAEEKRLQAKLDNVKFVISKANPLPCNDSVFDIVFCLNSLHHFPNHEDFLKEVSRVLKRGGRFVLLDLVEDNVIRKAWVNISKIIFREWDVEFHSSKEIASLIGNAGLKLENQRYFMFFTSVSISMKL